MVHGNFRPQAAFIFIIGGLIAMAPHVLAQTKPDPVRGKKAFEESTCAFCHANGGNSVNPKKPLKGGGFAKSFPDDKSIENVVRQGTKDGSMPAFNTKQVSDRDLKDIIAYIRTLTPKSAK